MELLVDKVVPEEHPKANAKRHDDVQSGRGGRSRTKLAVPSGREYRKSFVDFVTNMLAMLR